MNPCGAKFLYVIFLTILPAIILNAQTDTVNRFVLKDFRLLVKSISADTVFRFEDMYSLTLNSDSMVISRRTSRYGIRINDLNTIQIRNGGYSLIGFIIGAGLGIAVATAIIVSPEDKKCQGHPCFYISPDAIGVTLGLLLAGLGVTFGALTPRYDEYLLGASDKRTMLIKAIRKSKEE